MRNIVFLIIGITAFLFTSCTNDVRNVQPGWISKILTPTGWEKGIHEAGQIDIGQLDNMGRGNQLILMESTTITVKESFYKDTEDVNQDRRVKTKDQTPLSTDVYIQIAVPTDEKLRDNAFASITPIKISERVYEIKLENIYKAFAQMVVRGKIREAFTKYKNTQEVMDNYALLNAEIGASVIEVFKKSKMPCELVSVQLSNIIEDPDVLKSKNDLLSSANKVKEIENIGKVIRENPQYAVMMKWESLKTIAKENKGNVTIIVSDGKEPVISIPTTK